MKALAVAFWHGLACCLELHDYRDAAKIERGLWAIRRQQCQWCLRQRITDVILR